MRIYPQLDDVRLLYLRIGTFLLELPTVLYLAALATLIEGTTLLSLQYSVYNGPATNISIASVLAEERTCHNTKHRFTILDLGNLNTAARRCPPPTIEATVPSQHHSQVI